MQILFLIFFVQDNQMKPSYNWQSYCWPPQPQTKKNSLKEYVYINLMWFLCLCQRKKHLVYRIRTEASSKARNMKGRVKIYFFVSVNGNAVYPEPSRSGTRENGHGYIFPPLRFQDSVDAMSTTGDEDESDQFFIFYLLPKCCCWLIKYRKF